MYRLRLLGRRRGGTAVTPADHRLPPNHSASVPASSIAAINDGSDAPPRLRRELNFGTAWLLPAWSTGPHGGLGEMHEAAAAAGYTAVQGGDPIRCADLGLGCSTFGVVREHGVIDEQARMWADLGFECSTLHVGTGLEDDDEAARYFDAVLQASQDHDLPLYVETHRATLTQDIWRTLGFIERFPELRFNGDFSHWYTGLEMTYGDFDAKLAALAPVFERTRYLHGRIGDPGCIQVDIGPTGDHPSVEHFRRFWTEAMAGFLTSAGPGDLLPFAPELLPAEINYARTVPTPDGGRQEEGDRWAQGILYCTIAEECFEVALDKTVGSMSERPAIPGGDEAS